MVDKKKQFKKGSKQRRGSKKPYTNDYEKNGKGGRSDKVTRAEKYADTQQTSVRDKLPAGGGKNDASWYTYTNDMVMTAANLNYNMPVGQELNKQLEINPGGDTVIVASPTAPAVMAFTFTPTPGDLGDENFAGTSEARNAPVNLQMRSLYSYMQATVTQNLPFAASDLAIHLMFMDSLFMWYAHMLRLYYIYRKYAVMNRAIPNAIIRAYGIDPSTLTAQMSVADYAFELQKIEAELKRVWVPDKFDVLRRHYWMTSHIWTDAPSQKSQLYMFVPKYLWKYKVNPDDTKFMGGTLEATNVFPADNNVSQGFKRMCDIMWEMMESYYSDKDVWDLNGYILRAFDPNQFWMVDSVNLGGILEFDYSPEVLTQIHNMRVVGNLNAQATIEAYKPLEIKQTQYDTIAWTPYTTRVGIGDMSDSQKVFIDMPMDNPTPADNLVATRLIALGEAVTDQKVPGGGTIALTKITAMGTELVNGLHIYSGPDGEYNNNYYRYMIALGTTAAGEGVRSVGYDTFLGIAKRSHFQMGPMLFFTNDFYNWSTSGAGATPNASWFDVLGDVTNYTTISATDMRKLHDAAAIGEWLIKQ